MTERQSSRIFGKRATEHTTIIIASGERIRHMTVRPWMLALGATLAATLLLGYFAATAYLVLRDDLIGATMARQTRMQHAYEDRIAALRSEVDRITSRQLIDQRLMEDKVAKLIAHQEALSLRHGRLDEVLDRADPARPQEASAPVPTPRPPARAERQASAGAGSPFALITGAVPAGEAAPPAPLLGYAPTQRDGALHDAERLFSEMSLSLRTIERDQVAKVRSLAEDAFQTADAIRDAIRGAGLAVPQSAEEGLGGPYFEDEAGADFDASLVDLDQALSRLEDLRGHAEMMPLGHPAPGKPMTSRYGTRKDPFLNRTAFHSGADFRLGHGEPVRASGGGTIVAAGRNGGYGKMIDIDHGHGVVTRYAHLSRIDVREGQQVSPGQRIGQAGSTGRSTGPHLHYEVRRNDRPMDPLRVIEAGKSIEPLMAAR